MDKKLAQAGKTLVLIISCKPHNGLRSAIRSTWAEVIENHHSHYLFVVGDEGRPTRVENDVLLVNTKDNYEFLVLKVLLALTYVSQNLAGRYDYVFKVDDDCYVNFPRLTKLPYREHPYSGRVLQVHKRQPNASWHVGKCEDKRFESAYSKPYICNMPTGIGYFIRTDLLKVLAMEVPVVRRELENRQFDFEDKRVAETLYTYGVDAAPLDGYAAVFLAKKDATYSKEWRVDIEDKYRFSSFDVITECDANDILLIHRTVAVQPSNKV